MKIRITFTEELLGTASSNKDIHGKFVSSKAPNAPSMEEEVAARGPEEVEKEGTSIFARSVDGKPILWDYQIKGFFKDACSALSRVESTLSVKLKAHKKVIDGVIFVKPRQIVVTLPTGGTIGDCQRPLRAQTAQGERVALAHSEAIPAGAWIDVEILLLEPKLEPLVVEWLDYGSLRGLGQWRNSGKGRFTWQKL